jgi:hypothetical protein
MEYAIRTTAAFPKYLQAYWGSAKDINWTSADTKTRTWEDAAQMFNKIEADAILSELKSAGINHSTCTRSATVTLLCSRKSITPTLKELVSLRAIFKFIEVVKPAPKNDAVERKAAEVTNAVKNLFGLVWRNTTAPSTLDASSTTFQCR